MLRRLIKNKKAQNTAEYAILIALVVGAIIAMQTYSQRALQARVKDASTLMTDSGPVNATTNWGMRSGRQYEPYYLNKSYVSGTNEESTELQTNDVLGGVRMLSNSESRRTGGENELFNLSINADQ